jgi:hypothetical protein
MCALRLYHTVSISNMSECLNIGNFPNFPCVWRCGHVFCPLHGFSQIRSCSAPISLPACQLFSNLGFMGLVPTEWMFHIIKKQHLGQYNLGFSRVLLFFNMIQTKWRSDTYIPWLHPNLTGILTGRWLGPHVATHDSQSAPVWTEDPLDMYDIAA